MLKFAGIFLRTVIEINQSDELFQSMTISIHAKERAFERYEIQFSKRKWKLFEQTTRNPKFAIRLHGERLACYFEKQWFLVICKRDGTVLTFLALENISDIDKHVLKSNEQYQRINDDTFRVLGRNHDSSEFPRALPLPERSVELPAILTENELPQELLEPATKIMKKLCE